MARMSGDQVHEQIRELPGWSVTKNAITKTYELGDFKASLSLVNRAGELAEAAQHHPDIDIRYNKVTLTLSTHDEGGLTEKDFDLARRIEGL